MKTKTFKAIRFGIILGALFMATFTAAINLLRVVIARYTDWSFTLYFNNHGEGLLEFYVVFPLLFIIAISALWLYIRQIREEME